MYLKFKLKATEDSVSDKREKNFGTWNYIQVLQFVSLVLLNSSFVRFEARPSQM